MKKLFFLLILMPLAVLGQTVSRTELRNTNDLLRTTIISTNTAIMAFHGPQIGGLSNAVSNLQGATGALNTAVGNLQGATGALTTAVGNLQGATGALNTAVGNLQGATGALNTAVGNLQGATGALNTAVGNLQGATGALNTAVGNLNGVTGVLVKVVFTPSLSNATIKPLVKGVGNAAGQTNNTGEIYGLEQGTGITLTPNGSNLVIAATGGGGGTPGGSTTQVQFNDAGSFGGDGGLTYDKTTDSLLVGGSVTASNGFSSVAAAGQGGYFSLNSSNANGKVFMVQAGLLQSNIVLLPPTNGYAGQTPPVMLVVSNFVGDGNGMTGQLHWISQSLLTGYAQATNANLTFLQSLDTNSVIVRKATNYAYAASLVLDCSTDVEASITNSVTGNINLLLTNTVPGRGFNLYLSSDGSARTISVFCDKSIMMLSTNETLNSTSIVTTASKDMVIAGKMRLKTATSTNANLFAKSQP